MASNFPPPGSYVGTLCSVVNTKNRNDDPSLLIRFAVQGDEKDYSPTAFWSFSENAEKYVRPKCEALNLRYGKRGSVRSQLLKFVGKQFSVKICKSDSGYTQLDFEPIDTDEGGVATGSGYFDFDDGNTCEIDAELEDYGEVANTTGTVRCPYCQTALQLTVDLA